MLRIEDGEWAIASEHGYICPFCKKTTITFFLKVFTKNDKRYCQIICPLCKKMDEVIEDVGHKETNNNENLN